MHLNDIYEIVKTAMPDKNFDAYLKPPITNYLNQYMLDRNLDTYLIPVIADCLIEIPEEKIKEARHSNYTEIIYIYKSFNGIFRDIMLDCLNTYTKNIIRPSRYRNMISIENIMNCNMHHVIFILTEIFNINSNLECLINSSGESRKDLFDIFMYVVHALVENYHGDMLTNLALSNEDIADITRNQAAQIIKKIVQFHIPNSKILFVDCYLIFEHFNDNQLYKTYKLDLYDKTEVIFNAQNGVILNQPLFLEYDDDDTSTLMTINDTETSNDGTETSNDGTETSNDEDAVHDISSDDENDIGISISSVAIILQTFSDAISEFNATSHRRIYDKIKTTFEYILEMQKLVKQLEQADKFGLQAVIVSRTSCNLNVKFIEKTKIDELLKEPKKSENSCLICLDNIHDECSKNCGMLTGEQSCGATFCSSCFVSWSAINNSCPHCKRLFCIKPLNDALREES